jgi:hypothetical protein
MKHCRFCTAIIFGIVASLTLSPLSTSAQSSDDEDGSSSNLDAEVDRLESEVNGEDSDAADSTDETSENDTSLEAELDQLESDVSGDESGDGEDSDAPSSTSSGSSGGGAIQSLNPDLSVILDTGFAWHRREPGLVGGPDPKKFGFFLQNVELAFDAAVDPYFDFDAHLVAKLDGVKVGEAYATTLQLPARLQARVGKFKTDFGRVNPLHVHAWRYVTLPLINGTFFGPAGLNGLGAEISQILPLPWYVEWVVAAQDLGSPKTGRSFLRNPDAVESFDDWVGSARLEQFFTLSADWSLMWGLNYAVGRNHLTPSDVDSRTDLVGTDLFLKWRAARRRTEIGWQTEAVWRRRGLDEESLTDLGGYSYLYVRPNALWEIGGRYEYLGPTEGPTAGQPSVRSSARHRSGLVLSHYPTHFSRLRLQYTADELSSELEDWNHMVFLQMQFVTGAHGAHEF